MKRSINILIVIAVVLFAGLFAYNMIISRHNEEGKTETARKQVREEMKPPEELAVPSEKLVEAFGEAPANVTTGEKQISLENIERRIMAFFSYLDSQQYVSAYNLKSGTYQQFHQVMKELSSNPPVIAGETESLYTLYRNMSHFFRVMGKTRVLLTKDVLANEADILESAAANFYLWFTLNDKSVEGLKGRPSLDMLYQYSGYFLNTLAGRSYLLRRNPSVRILTTYYSIHILDRANDALLNSGGIDIRPHIRSVTAEIKTHNGFVNKDLYLSELKRLNEKYHL